jgi:hypothetical protein
MKKYIVITLLLINSVFYANAQKNEYTAEDMLKYFQNENIYEALDTYINKNGFNFNYKSIYHNDELQSYLMKLLDVDEYIEYLLEKYRINSKELMDRDEEEDTKDIYQVNYFITKECRLNFDSIYADRNLYLHYKELTLNWLVNRENIRLQKQKNDLLASDKALTLHSYIHYPRAYTIMLDWWLQKGESCIDEATGLNPFCIYLLRMNDPEVINEVNKIVNNILNNNIELALPIILTLQEEVLTSFSIEKLIQLSELKIDVSIMTPDEKVDISLYILKYLNTICYNRKILNNNLLYDLEQKEIYGKKRDKIFYDNRNKIISASKLLVEKLKEEERYWMVNMPFNK